MLKCNKKILKKLKQKKKGFTLLEIVVALAVIGIMMIPLGGALLTSVKTNKMGEVKQESKLISQEIIEKIRSFGDVKDSMTFNVGKDEYEINITEDGENFKVEGLGKDKNIIVTGKIENKENIVDSTEKYSKMQFSVFIYIGENETKYLVAKNKDSDKWNVDWYLSNINSDEAKATTKNDLKIVYDKKKPNYVNINGESISNVISSSDNIAGIDKKYGDIIIYAEVDEQGKFTRDDSVNLHIENSLSNTKDVYFINNKFDDSKPDKTVDIFSKDRFIDGDINIVDNIKYHDNNKNTGLYTINLDFQKKIPNGTTITESTRSEFLVTN